MQTDATEWSLPLQCFLLVFGLGFRFHGFINFCWFSYYEILLEFWVYSCKVRI